MIGYTKNTKIKVVDTVFLMNTFLNSDLINDITFQQTNDINAAIKGRIATISRPIVNRLSWIESIYTFLKKQLIWNRDDDAEAGNVIAPRKSYT